MKRTALKKKSKEKKSVLKRKLWKVFSLYIRTRDKNICFICGRYATGSGYHASHFIPKSIGGLELYFNEYNVHGCYKLKGKISKWTEEDYLKKIEYYSNL